MRGLLGDLIFGIDEQSMEAVVLEQLRKRAMTVAATETLTGGILSARMSALDPAMEVFRGAIVRPEAAAAGSRAASPEQRAGAAAAEARERFGTDVGLAADRTRSLRRSWARSGVPRRGDPGTHSTSRRSCSPRTASACASSA